MRAHVAQSVGQTRRGWVRDRRREQVAHSVGDPTSGGRIVIGHHRDRVPEVVIHVQLTVDAGKAAIVPDDPVALVVLVCKPIGVL